MKLDWNRKYTTIAVYAFLVIAAGLLLYFRSKPHTLYVNKKETIEE